MRCPHPGTPFTGGQPSFICKSWFEPQILIYLILLTILICVNNDNNNSPIPSAISSSAVSRPSYSSGLRETSVPADRLRTLSPLRFFPLSPLSSKEFFPSVLSSAFSLSPLLGGFFLSLQVLFFLSPLKCFFSFSPNFCSFFPTTVSVQLIFANRLCTLSSLSCFFSLFQLLPLIFSSPVSVQLIFVSQGRKVDESWQQCDGNPLTVLCQPTGLTFDNSYLDLDQVDDHNKKHSDHLIRR